MDAMTELTTKVFDYGDLSEPERRAFERHAERIADIRGRVARSAVEAGKELAEARDRFAHRGNGTFERWVEQRCGMTPRHARNFIAAFETFGGEPENVFRNFDNSALFLLSVAPEPARRKALQIATSGQVVTHKAAKALCESHSPVAATPGYSPHGTGKRVKKKRESKPEPKRHEPDPAPASQSLIPDDPEPPTVIETTATTVTEPDPELALRDALLPLFRQASNIANELIRPHVRKCLQDAIEMLSTGEPIEPDAEMPAESKDGRTIAEKCEAIYQAYPRKVGKQVAISSIRRALKRVTFETLLAAVQEYRDARAGKDEQFTPHPATWFNQGRWDDDRREWHRTDARDTKAPRRIGPGERFDPNTELGDL